MDMQAVASFHRHYTESILKNPDLYRNGTDMITVVLPKDLLDYSNASAGHSGFGSGARPVGIRRKVRNAEQALAQIFADVGSLAKFIEESECDGPAMVAEIQRKHAEKQLPRTVMAADSDGFWSKYNKDTMAALRAKIKDHTQLTQDFRTLSLSEFEHKYGLGDKLAV
jgi:hypothetical protein